VNARRSPQRILAAQRSNQVPDFARHYGPSSSAVPNLPGPKQAEAFAVPGDDGLGFDDDQRGPPIGPDSRQPRPEHAVRHGHLRPFLGRASDHTDLMPQRQDLHLESGALTEG
jgi:hypothetical protein